MDLSNDEKILLNDGSRIVRNKFQREEDIDIISKGAYDTMLFFKN